MKDVNIDSSFTNEIDFLDNILLLDSIDDNEKNYNLVVDYLKQDNNYLLSINVIDDNIELINTCCTIKNKIIGSTIIKDIINMFTDKYKKNIVVDVKELDNNKNCIKFGRRTYTSKK